MINGGNKVGYVLGYVHLFEPFARKQVGSSVCEVCTEYVVYHSFLISLVKLIKTRRKYRICGVGNYSFCLALFQLVSYIQH